MVDRVEEEQISRAWAYEFCDAFTSMNPRSPEEDEHLTGIMVQARAQAVADLTARLAATEAANKALREAYARAADGDPDEHILDNPPGSHAALDAALADERERCLDYFEELERKSWLLRSLGMLSEKEAEAYAQAEAKDQRAGWERALGTTPSGEEADRE